MKDKNTLKGNQENEHIYGSYHSNSLIFIYSFPFSLSKMSLSSHLSPSSPPPLKLNPSSDMEAWMLL